MECSEAGGAARKGAQQDRDCSGGWEFSGGGDAAEEGIAARQGAQQRKEVQWGRE